MRLLDTKTRYFDQDTFQIPQLENAWGAMINFLDTVLVNGSSSQPVLSLTIEEDLEYENKYWLLKVGLNKGHGFKKELSVVEISDSNIATFNQIYRVQETAETSITLALLKSEYPVKPTNLVYIVGVTIRQPSLGYEKVFEGDKKAVYKVTTKDDKSSYLRVDNSCPQGFDPSWAKFARVSMFESMEHVDDYKFKINTKKAPAYSNDYNKTEESVYHFWLGTSDSGGSSFYLNRAPNRPNKPYTIIGDSSTFYFHRKDVTYDSNYSTDVMYTFGKYIKNYYKEDPLPFILRCDQVEPDGVYASYYNRYGAIHRDRDWFNHTFTTTEHKVYDIPNSDRFALWLTDHFKSGRDTRISFLPYKNELPFNTIEMELRFFRPNNTVLEGKYRGLKIVMNNFLDYIEHRPKDYSVFKKTNSERYLVLPSRDYYDYSGPEMILVSLEDWEGL